MEVCAMDNFIVASTKEFTWDCAHMLEDHQGLCKNLHGHTYKMEVTVAQENGDLIPTGPSRGMVVDFKDLKEIVKKIIVDPLDHACMVNEISKDPFEVELGKLLEAHGRKIYYVDYRPTAENMAINFMDKINHELGIMQAPYMVAKIRVYETPTSYAEVMC